MTQALASPEVTLEAVTLTFGNTTLDYAFDNMMRLAHALQVTADAGALKNDTLQERVKNGNSGTPIPVALGATKPLGGRLFTAGYFHGRDGMSGVSFLEGDPFPKAVESKLFAQSELPSDELILDVLRRHPPNTVRIAAVAPLTNLAQAFLKDPETFRRVGVISVMGGALDVPGNTSPTAEFNFFADPWAAKVLLEDAVKDGQPPLPIYLFPLDITSKHTVPYGALVREEGDALYDESYLVRLISLFLRKPRSVTNSFAPPEVTFDASVYDLFEAHDPLAVAHAIFCESADGWKVTARPFLVESEGKLTRGYCVVEYVVLLTQPPQPWRVRARPQQGRDRRGAWPVERARARAGQEEACRGEGRGARAPRRAAHQRRDRDARHSMVLGNVPGAPRHAGIET